MQSTFRVVLTEKECIAIYTIFDSLKLELIQDVNPQLYLALF